DAESGEPVGRDSALELPCDVLVPAAVGGVIDSGNAGRVQAQIVVEGANAPTTPDAEAVLSERGIEIVPDLLANAGGVIASYFEWVEGLQGIEPLGGNVARGIVERISDSYEAVRQMSAE